MQTLMLLRAKLEGTTILGGGIARLRERDQLWVVPIAVVGVLVGLGGLVFLLFQNYRGIAILGASMGFPELGLYLAVVASWVVVFVLGFPIAVSVLYFSRDLRLLATLPLPAYRIVGANAGLLYLYALPVAAIFFVPGVVASVPVVVADAGFVMAAGLTVLLVPIVPLALAVLVVTGVTRLVNLSRFRVGLEAIGMVLIVVLLVGVQLLLSRSIVEASEGIELSEAMGAFVTGIRSAVPPAQWYARAMLPGGLPLLAGVVAGTVVAGAVAIAAVQAGYLRQLANQSVTVARRRRATPASLPSQHGPLATLVIRELKLLTSNSTFLFESVGEVFVFPIILLVLRVATPGEVLEELLPLLDQTDYLLVFVTGALVLFAGINSVSSAALSREGRTFDLSLSLPLAGSTQIMAKIATYLVLFGGAFVLNAVLATWILAMRWWHAPVIAVAGLPYITMIGVTTIYADLRRPHLQWNHPQQAVKQNVNVLIGMGIAIVAVGVAGLPAAVALTHGAAQPLVLALAAGSAVVVTAVTGRLVVRYADRRYAGAFAAA